MDKWTLCHSCLAVKWIRIWRSHFQCRGSLPSQEIDSLANSSKASIHSVWLHLCLFGLTKTVVDSCVLPGQRALVCSVCMSHQVPPSEWNLLCICKIKAQQLHDTFKIHHQHGVHILTIHFEKNCYKSNRLYTSLSLCADSVGPGKGWWPYRNECVCYILMMNPPEKQKQYYTASDG